MHHRIYTADRLESGAAVEVSGEEFHHTARVARVHEGEEVELFDGRGNGAAGTIESSASDRLTVRVRELLPSRESPLRITLAMAIIQLDRFEIVLQKATELGAVAIIPLVTDRVEVRPERYRRKNERWQKIVFEAVKQSGRSRIPLLEAPATFDEVILRDGIRMVFDADAEPTPPTPLETPAGLTLLVGPEGGWSEAEIEQARRSGCGFARLGPRRLRAETAAIVACGLMQARYGDWGW